MFISYIEKHYMAQKQWNMTLPLGGGIIEHILNLVQMYMEPGNTQ